MSATPYKVAYFPHEGPNKLKLFNLVDGEVVIGDPDTDEQVRIPTQMFRDIFEDMEKDGLLRYETPCKIGWLKDCHDGKMN